MKDKYVEEVDATPVLMAGAQYECYYSSVRINPRKSSLRLQLLCKHIE